MANQNKYQIFYKLVSDDDLKRSESDDKRNMLGLESFVKIFGLEPNKECEGKPITINELGEILLKSGIVENRLFIGKYLSVRAAKSIVKELYHFEPSRSFAFYFEPTINKNYVRAYTPKIKSAILDIPSEF